MAVISLIYTTQSLPDIIQRKIMPEPNSGCWLWTGQVAPHGYGKVPLKHPGGGWTNYYAHRTVYEILRGKIPSGLELDHKCSVRCCVNPDHLEPVTRRENQRRARKNRDALLARTHCKRGHPFDEVNTHWFKSDWTGLPVRRCNACHALWWSKYKDPRRGRH